MRKISNSTLIHEDLKRLSIDNTEQNKRLDEIENSMNETVEVFEVINDEFKELKRTDDLIKSDLTRNFFAKSSSIQALMLA